MKIIRTIILLVLTIGFLLCQIASGSSAFAFSYDGDHWDASYVYYDMSELPGSWAYSIMYAASAWNQAGADFLFAGSASSHDLITGYLPFGVLAWTESTIINHTISDSDTEFNTTYYTWDCDGGFHSVQSAATHEFGHWLELGDTYDSDDVMYHSYTGNCTLSDEDIDGIITIYGEY
jgi:hypothetical protein